MSRFCKFGKLHVTKGNVDKLLGIGHPNSTRAERCFVLHPEQPLLKFLKNFAKSC